MHLLARLWGDATRPDVSVPIRDYVDRCIADLAKYHDTGVAGLVKYHDSGITGLQAEIDRRFGELQRELAGQIRELSSAAEGERHALGKRIDTLADRIDKAEGALEQQRGRTAAYATISTVLITAVAVLTLVIGHIRF